MYVSLYPPAGEIIARWSGALLVGFQGDLTSSPTISATDRDEHLDRIAFDIPGASVINIRSVGGGFDKSIVVGGSAVSSDSRRAGFVAWISPDRQRRNVIRTEPFRPEAVVLDANGLIWAAGHLIDGETGSATATGLVRRYDVSGRMLSSIQLRNPDGTESRFSETSSLLLASKDRVGWLTLRTEYVEFTLDGTIRDRFQGLWPDDRSRSTRDLLGWGLSENNDVILEKARDERGRVEVVSLDRRNRVWIPVVLPAHSSDHPGRVAGFDGSTLVLSQKDVMERLRPVEGPIRKK